MKTILLLLVIASAVLTVRSEVLLSESFSYADGVLQDVSDGKWVGHSGATNQVDVSAGAVNLTGSEAQDVNAGLTNGPFMADGGMVLYAGFRITFSALPGKSGSYFAHFKSSSATGFRGRIWSIKTPDGKFNLGISSVGSADPFALFPLDLELNSEYQVVMKLEVATALATLWINPDSESDANVQSDTGAGLNITSFALRQSSGMGTMKMDDLIVATTFKEAIGQTLNKPVILQQPASTNVFVGSSASFTVEASGPDPLTYQWLFNGAEISGQTDSTLTIPSVSDGDGGIYTVSVSNNDGSALSAGATLTIEIPATPPNITQQPMGKAVDTGETVSFEIVANGTEPLAYQWWFDDLEMPGETGAALTLVNVTLANTGAYKVRVTNSAGFIVSEIATLFVREPVITPGISQQPASRTVDAGETVVFHVVASGTEPLAYQWLVDDFEFTGETAPTLTLSAVSAANTGAYKVRISNSAGSILSDAATLIVRPPVIAPSIIRQPQSASVEVGGTILFLAVATGTEPLRYQWLFGDVEIPGETSPTLNLLGVSLANAGGYKIRVSNDKGPVLSEEAQLTVVIPAISPSISQQPHGGISEIGGSFSFTVNAAGTEPLMYQWNKDGQSLDGQTSSMLLLQKLTTNDAGYYSVSISNDGNSILSEPALLQIEPPPVIESPRVTFVNYLSHLVRTGDRETNTFAEHALFVGETLRMELAVSDPAGREIALIVNTNELPLQTHWTSSKISSTNITADFEFTPSQDSSGRAYVFRLRANNGSATNELEWSFYVPTIQEQNIVFTEFLVNPISDTSSPYFNPLHRAVPSPNSSSEDQYIEIANLSANEIDLVGWTVSDSVRVWQKFNDASSLQPSNALIVYGGPSIGSEPMLETRAIPASEGGSDSGLSEGVENMLILRNADGHLISRVVYGPLVSRSSMTRYPDENGAFVPQESVGMNLFSPGNKWNGDPFTELLPMLPIGSMSVETMSGHKVHLAWHSREGQTYTILRATSLSESFALIAGPLQFSGENGEYTDSVGSSEAIFYLVRSP